LVFGALPQAIESGPSRRLINGDWQGKLPPKVGNATKPCQSPSLRPNTECAAPAASNSDED
jgi:hypothetical protein